MTNPIDEAIKLLDNAINFTAGRVSPTRVTIHTTRAKQTLEDLRTFKADNIIIPKNDVSKELSEILARLDESREIDDEDRETIREAAALITQQIEKTDEI